MKRLLLFIAAIFLLSSCERINATGPVTTQEYLISSSATSINVRSAIELILSDEVEPGTLLIETNANIHRYVDVSSSSRRISISLDSFKVYGSGVFVRVYGSSLQYNDLSASGASSIYIEGPRVYSRDYKLDLSGASYFIGEVCADRDFFVDISGASKADIRGWSTRCFMNLAGASRFYGIYFECNELDVDIAGASNADIYVHDYISGDLAGASSLRYAGNPIINVLPSGSSFVGRY